MHINKWASQAGECREVARTICTDLCLLQSVCCTLLWVSEAPFLAWLISQLVKGVPSVRERFLFHSSLPRAQVLSHFLFFFFFLTFIPSSYMVIFLVTLVVWDLLPTFSIYSVRIGLFVDVFLMYLWEEVSSMSFYSTVLISSPYALCWEYIWYLNSRRYCTMLYPQGFVILPFRSICIIYLELIFYSMR